MSLCLSFQKPLDTTNKVIIVCIALIIFNITFNNIKQQQKYNFIQQENFTSNDNYNDLEKQAETITVTSPSYSDVNNEDENEEEYDTNNFDDILNKEYADPETLGEEDEDVQYIMDKFDDVSSITSVPPQGHRTTTITQSDLEGTGNVFNPQIIINEGSKGTANIQMKASPLEKAQTIYQKTQDWQTPANDLYDETHDDLISSINLKDSKRHSTTLNTGPALGTPNYVEQQDPWETMQKNMKLSYEQELEDRNTCGKISRPFRKRKTQFDVSSPFNESKRAVNKLDSNSKQNINARKTEQRGYTYMPPSQWDIPKYIPSCTTKKCIRPKGIYGMGTPSDAIKTCPSNNNECDEPDGVFTSGSDLNVLELDNNGEMSMSEKDIRQTNIGSILPKFKYSEH